MSRSRSISVAMATYNGASYIQEQLDSIAAQTVLPHELVVTDDGSTDITLEIVEQFAKTAPFPVRVFRNTVRLLYADNFLRAAGLTEGDLIAFSDQDDIWEKDKLALCLPYFEDPEVLLTIHSGQTFLQGGIRGRMYPEIRRTFIAPANTSYVFENQPGFAMICRRTLIDLGGTDPRPLNLYSHDHWIWFLAASVGKIANISSPLTLYRQHEANFYGSPARKTLAKKLSIATDIPNYAEVSGAEAECAAFLERTAQRCPDSLLANLKKTVLTLKQRSALHRDRAALYRDESTFSQRLHLYAQIHFAAGVRLGPLAALKDFFMGVVGFRKKSGLSATRP